MATKKKIPAAAALEESGDVMTPPDASGPRVLHVNGKPVPEAFAHAIPYDMTDEGIAESNARKVEPSGVKLTADAWDKNMDHRRDLADSGDSSFELWEATDPALAAVQKYGKPGMANRLLGPTVMRKKGLRGWKPVMAANGDPVKVGDMLLGEMPEARRQVRIQKYLQLAAEAKNENAANISETQEKLIRDSGFSEDVRALRAGEQLSDYRDPGAGITVGVSSTRGNRA